MELIVALAATAALVLLQVVVMLHSGPLWRDEITSVHVASAPTVGEMLNLYWFDSFPVLFHFVLRGWMDVGLGGSDAMLRILPFVLNLGVFGAIWWTARRLDLRAPLITLVLFGLSPTVLRFGTGVRAYSLGLLLMFLLIGLFWWLIQKPTRTRILVTAVVAILAVQSVYVNAVMLLAIGIAAGLVCLRRRQWKTIGLIAGIGGVAAVSLLPYVPTMLRSSEWSALVRKPIDAQWMFTKFAEAAGCGFSFPDLMLWLWIGVALAGLAACCYSLKPSADNPPPRQDLALYILGILVAGTVCFFGYVKVISVTTQVWYYIPVMGVAALAADAGVERLIRSSLPARLVRLGLVLTLAAVTWSSAWESAHMRWTNMDLVAAKVQALADKDDFILVNPHYLGTAFDRYYKGSTPWSTLPELDQYYFQSYTSFKQKMTQPDPTQPLRERIAATLQAGHRVWLVGGVNLPPPGQKVDPLPPAPYSPYGWSEPAYTQIWALQVGADLRTEAKHLTGVKVPVEDPVFPFEDAPLWVADRLP